MNDIIDSLLNPWVFLYLAIVVIVQIVLVHLRSYRVNVQRQKRSNAGLTDEVFVNHKQRLKSLRDDALIDAALLVGSVVVTPFVLIFLAFHTGGAAEVTGMASTFLVLLLWVLFLSLIHI